MTACVPQMSKIKPFLTLVDFKVCLYIEIVFEK